MAMYIHFSLKHDDFPYSYVKLPEDDDHQPMDFGVTPL